MLFGAWSVSPWGRARAQDMASTCLPIDSSVSPWGRARAQDHNANLLGPSSSVSPWGRARAQDWNLDHIDVFTSVSPWGRARAQDLPFDRLGARPSVSPWGRGSSIEQKGPVRQNGSVRGERLLYLMGDSRITTGDRSLFSCPTVGQLRFNLVSLSVKDQLALLML